MVNVTITRDGEQFMNRDCQGAITFITNNYNGNEDIRQVELCMIGKLSAAEIARQIMTMAKDENREDFWRDVVTNILSIMMADRMGVDLLHHISDADAFALDAIKKAVLDSEADRRAETGGEVG